MKERRIRYGILVAGWIASLGVAYTLGIRHTDRRLETASSPGSYHSREEIGSNKSILPEEIALSEARFDLERREPEAEGTVTQSLQRFYLEAKNKSQPDQKIRDFFWDLAPNDIKETVAFIENMPVGYEQDYMLYALMRRWAGLDSGAALEYALSIQRLPMRERSVRSVLFVWGRVEPEKAFEWAYDNPSPGKVERRLSSVFRGIADADASKAIAMLKGVGDYRELRNLTGVAVRAAYGQGRKNEVISWVEGMEEGDLKRNVINNLLGMWGGHEPAAALAWVETFEDKGIREQAFDQIVNSLSRTDPESAAQWANELRDDGYGGRSGLQ